MNRFAAICLLLVPQMAAAFDVSLPEGASTLASRTVADGQYRLPTGVFAQGAVPFETVEGQVITRTWRIPGLADRATAIMRSLEEQLVAQGYEIVVSCDTDVCGGFDFRFAIDVLPPPDMYVDLADFRYVSARRGEGDGAEAVGVVISHTVLAAMVQVSTVTPIVPEALDLVPAPEASQTSETEALPVPVVVANLAQGLETQGQAVLSGLTFQTGASTLGEDPVGTLAALAGWLQDNPERRVVLVGHTDSEGDLDRNIALSQERAQAVMQALVERYDIPVEQVSARGIGFLAPRATNATEQGRKANRRVEVVLLP